MGKHGHFLACEGYPDCTYSSDYERDEKGVIQPIAPASEEVTDKTCPLCNKPLVVKRGKYGEFLACTGYPECKFTQSIGSANGSGKSTGVQCPEKGCDGDIVEKSSRRGKIFYGCSNFPKCNFATWDLPVNTVCPKCNSPYMLKKSTKKNGDFLLCPNKECRHQEPL